MQYVDGCKRKYPLYIFCNQLPIPNFAQNRETGNRFLETISLTKGSEDGKDI
jgi:hypothetical protein